MSSNEKLLISALRDVLLSCRKYAPTIDRSRGEYILRKLGFPLDKPNINAVNGLGFTIGETMIKSSSEILREYANIISEGDLGNPHNNTAEDQDQWEPEDELGYNNEGGPLRDAINANGDEENGIDLPDESMMDQDDQKFENNWDDPEIPNTNPGDPAGELASFLNTDADKINEFLRKNNLELTPVGGLANSKGNI